MARHKGDPTPWVLLTEAAIAYADAETEKDFELAEYRLRYAAKHYRDKPGPQGRRAKENGAGGTAPSKEQQEAQPQPTR